MTPPASTALRPAALLQRKDTIALVSLLIIAIAVPCIWLLIPPMYQATAAVYVSPVISRMLYPTENNGVLPLYQQHLNTQAHILKSPAVLEHVVDQERIRKTHWYREEGKSLWGSSPSHLDRLKSALTVTPSGISEVITVSIKTRVPREAKLIVDAVVEQYEKSSRAAMSETDAEVFKQLDEDSQRLQKDILALDSARYNLSKQVGTLTPEELRSQQSTHLSVLESKRAEIERDLALTRFELGALASRMGPFPEGQSGEQEGVQKRGAALGPPDGRYADDPEWRQLNAGLKTNQHQLRLAELELGPSNPKLLGYRSEVALAELLLSDREWQLDQLLQYAGRVGPVTEEGLPPPHSKAGLDREARRLEYELSLIAKDVQQQRERVSSVGDIAQRLAVYDEDLRRNREHRDLIRGRLLVLETESKAPMHIRIAHASEPSLPDQHRRAFLTVLAILGALMAGVAVAYVRTAFDPVIRGSDDLPTTPRSPFLGRLPLLSGDVDLAGDASHSLLEHVRMVRTALLERVKGMESAVALVTSCSTRTGKTSVAVLLARSLAQLGKKVLLVEADFYRPCLGTRLGLAPGPGLMELLSGRVSDGDAIVSGGAPRFDLITAGQEESGFDPELLANGQFASALHRWRTTYPFILLDGPPVLPVADARILSRHADGTIMVLRSSHCRKPDMVQAYADLSAAGGTLLGTVLVGGDVGEEYGYRGQPLRSEAPPRLLRERA